MAKSQAEQYYIAMNAMHDDGSENHPAAQLRCLLKESRQITEKRQPTKREIVFKMANELDSIADELFEDFHTIIIASSGVVTHRVKKSNLHTLSREELCKKRDESLCNILAKIQAKIQQLDAYIGTNEQFDLLRDDITR